MENNYILYVGMDVSKGKADVAILKVSDRRSVKPKFLRKNYLLSLLNQKLLLLETVRSYSDVNCTSICFALEVTGIYSTNVYDYIKANLYENESIKFLNTDFVNQWRIAHNIAKSDPLDAQTISTIIGTDLDVQYVNDNVFENKNGYQDLKALVHRHYQIKKSILKKSTVSLPNAIVCFLNFNMFSNLNQLLLSLSYLHILRHMIS
ncbi:IS110 family transposase [Catenibacterium sp.]|uniref:IS110 family transposase n=1 Tax=Catenibacterium sp. TaxID=2049022 RepID=UPI0039961BDA